MDEKPLKLTNEAIASIENIEKLINEHMPTTEAFTETIKTQALMILKQEELIEVLKNRINNYEEQIERYEGLLKIDNNRGAPDGKNDCGITPI